VFKSDIACRNAKGHDIGMGVRHENRKGVVDAWICINQQLRLGHGVKNLRDW
jgi:hypothetical protein